MTDLSQADVYLVGSMAVPTDTVEEAMRLGAKQCGDRLFALPDGEVGARAWWVGGLGTMVFSKHPGPFQVGEDESFHPTDGPFGELGTYRVKGDPDEVSFEGLLPYAPAAIESYATFRDLKEAGDLPRDVRFQVAVPTPFAAIQPFFGDPAEWPGLWRAWQRAITADIVAILEVVPAAELSLQWDYATEVVDVIGAATGRRELGVISPWQPELSVDEAFALYTDPAYVRPFADQVPDEVTFGYHLCLGTFPQFPTVRVDDLSEVVRLANSIVADTPRHVDFLHLPSLPDAGRDFYAPLRELEVGDARVFLGLEHRDGSEAIRARGEIAREFLPEFGISHYCGYGRDDRDQITTLLGDLRAGADLLAGRAGS